MNPIEPIDEQERRLIEAEATSELISQMVDDAQALIRGELERAKGELEYQLDKTKNASKAIAAGAVIAFITSLVFSFALVALLAEFMAPWIAGLIVTVVYGLAAFIAIKKGLSTLKTVEPTRAIEPFKEEGRWIKKTVRDIRSHKREHTLH